MASLALGVSGLDCNESKSPVHLTSDGSRGHCVHKGQELADGLAKEAARETQGMRATVVTLKDVKHFVQCKTAKAWQTRWQNYMGAAKKFIQVINPNKMKYIKKDV